MPSDRTAKALKKQARVADELEHNSLLVWENCEWCGKRYAVNNYADHERRVERFRGRQICPWCKHSWFRLKEVRRAVALVDDLAKLPCDEGHTKKKRRRACECTPCRSWRITRGE